ncbi:Sec23-binding domain of Sec16-domain-containing protein [Xylariaceae sp. FL0804]|nr:Sec23-binding domain of Sec16-domain-containing protein [Xylariaceae sp. FL0804]
MQPQHSPPPMGIPSSNSLSPPKRSTSNYAPQPAATMPPKEVTFVPPPRSQTQSPGAVYGRTAGRPADPIPRPSSVQGPTSPRQVPATPMRTVRARGMSQHLNLVTPTDGRELDPLQRWQGAPCFSWGVGGVFVTSFPKDMPRYGINSAVPQITRSPGEIRMKHMKDVLPLEERLAKFPGPLKGKSKKKETLAWLATGIDLLEKSLPSVSFRQHVAHDEKRAVERVLLWKILRVFVENDGALGGTPAADNTVRDIISPGVDAANTAMSTAISSGVDLTGMSSPMTAMQADTVDSTAIEQIRRYLLSGDREKAVWAAADKRLWGHALLIANTSQSADLYKQVSREFIKKEVTHSGHGNESLAALYGVLSGNFEESVDELVPAHARAGLQMMPTSSAVGGSEDALAGLDKWRETLGLILSNRSQGDVQALRSLGNLLAEYGRAEAAHICYIFAGNFATFGGLSDSNASFVLLGADHRHQADQFGKQTEALQLSEVYEYGLSLAPGSNVPQSCPHLAAYKLQHAEILAEHGLRDKALQYCEGIYSAMNAQTKRSPYYNASLESSVYDFMRRLKQAPKEESSSWITKPKMDQVSNTMWNKFNKFVAGGDDDGENGAGGEAGAESGPFARVAGGTPTISRSPSISNFEIYGSSPNNPMVPATAASSRYAPGAAQAPASPYEPMNSYGRGSNDLPRPGAETQASYSSGYAPAPPTENGYLSPPGYQPSPSITTGASPYMPVSQDSPAAPATLQRTGDSFSGYQPYGTGLGLETPGVSQQFGTATPDSKEQQSAIESSAPTGYQPSYGGYGAPSMGTFESPSMQPESSGGYEPPSYEPSTFEPPSYQPGPADDDDVDNKRRKNMMDDDEDDMSALGGNGKTKAEKDRENEEMFRKVAEEEAKRAAEAKAASAKKGWGFGGWFGGGGSSKKEPAEQQQQQLNKPVKAKLGEASSFVYDPDLKRWINKKPGAENAPAKTATPPPPRANGRTPPPPGATSAPPPPPPPSAGPPSGQPSPRPPGLSKAFSQDTLGAAAAGGALLPPMARSFSSASAPGGPMTMPGSAPPSRPGTSLSNASSIDDLLSSAAAGPRKAGKKPRKSGRYVDVMAK